MRGPAKGGVTLELFGWQAIFGGLLVLLGGENMLTPEVGGLIVPVALVLLGIVLLVGGSRAR